MENKTLLEISIAQVYSIILFLTIHHGTIAKTHNIHIQTYIPLYRRSCSGNVKTSPNTRNNTSYIYNKNQSTEKLKIFFRMR